MAKDKDIKKVDDDEIVQEGVAEVAAGEATGGAKKKKAHKTSGKSKSKSSKVKKGHSKSMKGGKKNNKAAKEKSDRYFKLIDAKNGASYGRYTGETPKQAASKGYTKLLQKLKDKNKIIPKETTIYLRESTRGSNRKVYGYSASRQKLDQPQKLIIEDKESGEKKTITYNYRNKIKKVAVPEHLGGAKKKKAAKKGSAKKSKKSTKKSGSKTKKVSKRGSKSAKKSKKASASKAA